MVGLPNARACALLLLGTGWLVVPLTAQQSEVPHGDQRGLRRAADDTRTACRELLAQPIAFTGSCRFAAGRAGFAGDQESIPFRGAFHQGLSMFALREHTVLIHDKRQLERIGGGGWTTPQGNAPDLPFSPRTLAQHIGAATIDTVEPVFLDGRPAMRVHAVWSGEAAAALLHECTHPDTHAQQILERLPNIVTRQQPERICVDAAVCFDPATRTLKSVVVRVALLDGNELRPDDEPPPAPDGLPTLPRTPLLEYTFVVTVVPLADVPLPDLDASLRERLAWPPPAAPQSIR